MPRLSLPNPGSTDFYLLSFSLLILLESVLAPILVWAVVGEDPGSWALVGGVVVIGALVASNLVVLMRRREV